MKSFVAFDKWIPPKFSSALTGMGLRLSYKCECINSNKQVFLFILTQKIKLKDRFHLGWFKGTAWMEARYKLSEHSNINTSCWRLSSRQQWDTSMIQKNTSAHKPTHSTGKGLLICCQYVIHNDRLVFLKFRLEFYYLLWGIIIRKNPKVR